MRSENFSVDESWLSPQPLASEPKSQLELSQKLAAQEKEMIEAAAARKRRASVRPSGAAAKLGIHRSTLESKITSLKIDKYRFKSASASKIVNAPCYSKRTLLKTLVGNFGIY